MNKISEPGIYDIPMDDYHGDFCVGPSVSSSVIRKILSKSPAHAWATSPFNPKRVEEKTSDAFSFGKAIADWLAYGGLSDDKYLILPKDFNGRTSEGKAIIADAAKNKVVVIKQSHMDDIKKMQAALEAHPYATAAFKGGNPERSLIWKDEETGLWMKARPDYLPHALKIIPDYKTAASGHPEDFCRDVGKYGYHIQAAMALEGIEVLTGKTPKSFIFVVQEKSPPYVVQVYDLDADDLEIGRAMLLRGKRIFAECLEKDHWPGYSDRPISASIPMWKRGQLIQEYESEIYEVRSRNDQRETDDQNILAAG